MRHDGSTRRAFLRGALLAAGALGSGPFLRFGRCRLLADSPIEVSTRAVDLVRETTVVDMLGLLTLDWQRYGAWQREAAFSELDYRTIEYAGVRILHQAVETPGAERHAAALRWVAGWNALLEAQACFLAPVTGLSDLLLVPQRGQIGLLLGFQNGDHFRNDDDVRHFHALGQRVSQLTYNERNALGSGCYERHDAGLTELGATVVATMNEVGMAVDLSHAGERTAREAVASSHRPVLVTHANCKALVPHPRCVSDGLLRVLAASGGVIGITAVKAFVSARSTATLDDLLDHFLHVARTVGIEHVGIGSDVDLEARSPTTGRPNPHYVVRGLDPRLRAYQLADGLLRRGVAPRDVELVLGGNFRRALAGIWRTDPWQPVAPFAARRDPFCPAPRHPLPAIPSTA